MIVQYGDHSSQFGELTVPNTTGPHPVLVIIHGGYWKDNHTLHSYATTALATEFCHTNAVWNIEYRRIPFAGENTTLVTNILSDVSTGFEHLLKIKDQYNLDLDHILLVGHSAGGHLATWLSSRPASLLMPTQTISVSGVLDLSTPELACQPQQIMRLLNDDISNLAIANPMDMTLQVPLTVVHGSADATIDHQMAVNYTNKHNINLITYHNCDHFGMLPLDHPTHWDDLKNLVTLKFNKEFL